MAKVALAVTLYTQTQAWTGCIYRRYAERLLDLLNGVSNQPQSRGRFLALSDVTIQYADSKKERLPTVYINKATIELATTSGGELARGIGAKAGYKTYPFVHKVPVPVELRTPAYAVIGNMHCNGRHGVWNVLEEGPTFLPLTDVRIRSLVNDIWWDAPFTAVNREKILSLQETVP
jgi:hypothetical protein